MWGRVYCTNPTSVKRTFSYSPLSDLQIGEALKKGSKNDLFLHYIFMDNAFELPTGLGLQLQMSSTGVIAPGIHAGVKLEVAKVRLSSPLIPWVVVFLRGGFLLQSANVFLVQDEVPCQCSHLIRLDEKLRGSMGRATSLTPLGHGGHVRTQLFFDHRRISIIFFLVLTVNLGTS